MTALWIGLMGMLGGASRYGLSCLFAAGQGFPWLTLGINIAGAFGLPLWTQWLAPRFRLSERATMAGGTGFFGAFTTFSTFSVEWVKLVFAQAYGPAALYLAITVIGGGLAALSAATLAQWLLGREQEGES